MSRFVLIVLLGGLCVLLSAAAAPAAIKKEQRASAAQVELASLRRAEWKHQSVIRFFHNPKRVWMLHLNQAGRPCWKVHLSGPERVCSIARGAVRTSLARLNKLEPKIQVLEQMLRTSEQVALDLAATESARRCIIGYESIHEPDPYTALNHTGSGAAGAYQYMGGTWRYVLGEASRYYRIHISDASEANYASPWAQNVVTAFAVAHPELLDHKPWTWGCY